MFITGDEVSWSLGRDGALFLQKKYLIPGSHKKSAEMHIYTGSV